MTERELTDAVIELAQLLGWKVLHLRPAQTAKGWRTPLQGDGVGWPDLFMVKPGVDSLGYGMAPIAVELKVGKNKPSQAQLDWLEWLEEAGCWTAVWREKDWLDGTVERVLRGEG